MEIIISAIESNARRNGEAVINGINVSVANHGIAGSEKQVAWAVKILEAALKEAAIGALKKTGVDFRLAVVSADLLDAAVSKVNALMASVIAPKLAATSAAKWIDNRDLDAQRLLKTMMEG